MAENVLKISGKTIEISEVSGEVFEIAAGQFWIRTGDGHESTFKLPADVPVPRVTHNVSVVYAGNEKTDIWYDCILVNRTTQEWHFVADVGAVFRTFLSSTGPNLFVWLPILLVVLFFLSAEKDSAAGLLVGVVLIFVYGIPAALIARAAANSKGKQLQRKLERYAHSLLEKIAVGPPQAIYSDARVSRQRGLFVEADSGAGMNGRCPAHAESGLDRSLIRSAIAMTSARSSGLSPPSPSQAPTSLCAIGSSVRPTR